MAWLRFSLMTFLLAFAQPVLAKTHITATLLAETPVPAPGKAITLAVVMQPEPGWHGYWKNPGDAGVPLSLEWNLPKGATVSALRFPVPETLTVSGLMNHVYTGEHALLTTLTLPRALPVGSKIPLRAKGQWLACTDKICVPEQGEISLDLAVGAGKIDPVMLTRFDGWRQKLPQPLGAAAQFEASGKRIRFGIPFPASAAIADPHFFAETERALSYAANQSFSRDGDRIVIETDAAGAATRQQIEGVLSVGGGKGFEIAATPGAVPAGGTPLDKEATSDWQTLLIALGGAILGGLILNIMPCVFPIISLKALSLARAGGDERAAKREAPAYAAGVILTCMALGGLLLALRAGGVAVGWAFQLQNPWSLGFLLLLAIAITLNLAGVFHLRAFGGGESLVQKGGTAGAFWTGILAAFVATPCTGPFMAAALGAALVLPVAAALAIFAGLGLGLALPFLAIAYIPALRTRMPKPGAWMIKFQRFLAIPMALTALALGWLLWTQIHPHSASAAATNQVKFEEQRLAALTHQGKPVFLYFTADWCLTCKVNEKAAIEREEVEAAFRTGGVTVMVGDWTNGDAAITRFLEAHQRSGVPYYLWYPIGGGQPTELPQVLTPGMLTSLVK